MTTDRERDKVFKAVRKRLHRQYSQTQRLALADVRKLLSRAQSDILSILQAAPSEYQAWQLASLNQSIELALADIAEDLKRSGSTHIEGAFKTGVAIVDEPLAAGGLRVAALLQDVDTRQLAAMRSFFTGKLAEVTAEAAAKVRTHLGLSMVGTQTTGDTVSQVARILKSSRSRAITITRTEIGRAFSVAAQERMNQASEVVPGLRKQWRRSGKVHSRVEHDLADGQIKKPNEPFEIGGHRLMMPRDPLGPAKETINCGCDALPYMESWDMRQPGRQAFTDDEISRNPRKRDLASALDGPST